MFHFNTVLVVCALFAIPVITQASEDNQNNVVSRYLQQVNSDFQQQLPIESSLIVAKSNVLNQWVESSEIRLTAENDDDRKRSVALNLKIRNPSELGIQQQLFNLLERSEQLDQQQILNQHLHSSYLQLVDLKSKLEQLAHLQKQSKLSATEIKYQRDLVQSNDFNAENLLDSELVQQQVKLQIELQHQQLGTLKKSMDLNVQNTFLTINSEQMMTRVEHYLSQNPSDVEQAQINLKLAQLKLKQQKSSEGFALNALQLKSDFADDQDTVLAVRFDIQIPFAGPDYSHQLRQQEIARASKRLYQDSQQAVFKGTLIQQEMQQQLSTLSASKKLSVQIASRILKTTSPQLLLKLKKQHLNQLKKVMEIRHNIRINYIKFLAQRGLLAKYNQNNWLSSKLSTNSVEQ